MAYVVLVEKQCTSCEETKPVTSFPLTNGYRRNQCRKCRKTKYPDGRRNLRPSRRYRYGTLYSLDRAAFDQMLILQSGRCAVCADPLSKLHVDHDHSTGEVRGLLCPRCNIGVGHFRDNPALLQSAAMYLAGASCMSGGDMDKPEHCQYPERLGGCETEEIVPVHWGDEKTTIGWLCTYHAMSLMLKGATSG